MITIGKLSNETNPIDKLWIDRETLLQRIKWKYGWGRFSSNLGVLHTCLQGVHPLKTETCSNLHEIFICRKHIKRKE